MLLGARRSSTFKFDLQQPGSSHVFCKRCGMLPFRLPRSCGLLPGAGARQVARGSRHAVRPVLLQRAHAVSWGIEWHCRPLRNMPFISRFCTVATTFISHDSRRLCFGSGRQHVVAITLFRMAELPGTFKGMLPTAFVVLSLVLCCMPFVSVRCLILSATLGWNA